MLLLLRSNARQVKTGKNFTLSLECTTEETITAGTFVTEVFLAGVPVHLPPPIVITICLEEGARE
jgi:hypothetical protein